MEIGYKITKPVETQEQCDSYAEVAKWCNNNSCHIEDKGDYYIVVENPVVETDPITPTPTLEDRVTELEQENEALNDTMLELIEQFETAMSAE